MKGILLAGGLGTRLYPATKEINKHVLLVYDRPMFFWPLQTLIDSDIKEIAAVSGPPHGEQVKRLIKHFPKKKNVEITYVLQDAPQGMPDAISRCKNFAKGDSVIVATADNFFENGFKKEVSQFKKGAISFLRKVKHPGCYGVPIYDGEKLIKIEEKPKNPPTNWIVSGPHIYDKNVFDYITKLKLSKRGELEISDLNTLYLKTGRLKLIKRLDFWRDMGTFDSLLESSNFVKEKVT